MENWTVEAIRDRGRTLAERAVEIWKDVTPKTDPSEAGKSMASPPSRIRFRDVEEPVSNWNDAFIKLVQHFEQNSPGLLRRIATDGSLYGFISLEKDRFRRSKTQIGDVYVNKHASAAQLREWCRKLATLGGYEATEYEFVMPDPSSVA